MADLIASYLVFVAVGFFALILPAVIFQSMLIGIVAGGGVVGSVILSMVLSIIGEIQYEQEMDRKHGKGQWGGGM